MQNSFDARLATLKAHRLAATSKDINAILGNTKKASVFEFTPVINAQIDAWGIDPSLIINSDRNPKVIKRFIQFIYAVQVADYKEVDRTTAICVYALQAAGGMPLTTDALTYLGAQLKKGAMSPETRGVSKTTLGKLFDGFTGLGSIRSQLSRTFGENGFMQLTGASIGEPGKVNQRVLINEKHPMVIAFFAMMNKATPEQLAQIRAPKNEE